MPTSLPPAAGLTDLTRFLARFDAFCAATGWPQVRLSRALFADDGRVAEIRNSASDVGIKRLARADAELARLAAEAHITLPEALDGAESDRESPRPRSAGARS